MNTLIIKDDHISDSKIVSGNLTTSHSLTGETLSADTLQITLYIGRNVTQGFIPKGEDLPLVTASGKTFLCYYQRALQEYIPKGTNLPLKTKTGDDFYCTYQKPLNLGSYNIGDPIFYYSDNFLVGKFYLQSITQINRFQYQLEATSAVGVLETLKDYGGIYEEVPAKNLLDSLLGDIPHSIDDAIGNATVTGYLPISSKRENLQSVLFATGGALFTKDDGSVFVSVMSDVVNGEFPSPHCYTGGSVETGEVVDGVEVTEHNFFVSGETQVLYEDGVSGSITLEFSEPYHDLVCSGGKITESGANYCKITASGFVTLTGEKYTHITRTVTAGALNNGENNIKTVSDVYLANPQISQTLANRVFAMLQKNETIKQDVTFGTERAGNLVDIVNPYSMRSVQAAIKGLDISISAKSKATGEFVVGFVPEGVVSGYKNYVMLKGTGYWTVPSSAGDTIRVIMIGAGTGGQGGYGGKNGGKGSDGSKDFRSVAASGTGGQGGNGGAAGTGGKIYELTLLVSSGDRFSYSCGTGGTGGPGGTAGNDGQKGKDGTATVFGGHSSDSGKIYPYGYVEKKTGGVYGLDGTSGKQGAAGGKGGEYPNSSSSIVFGADGSSAGSYSGGKGASGEYSNYVENYDTLSLRSGGGGGGGAAYGSSGGSASRGSFSDDKETITGGKGGTGGKGSSGSAGTNYGNGGNGGNGGGGGGGGGAAFRRSFGEYTQGIAKSGTGGTGGTGGNGGKGGDGIIIVYY